ncbi:MAG: hypothetical protein WKF71_18195 [Pyrinomonadaceae bacterium]
MLKANSKTISSGAEILALRTKPLLPHSLINPSLCIISLPSSKRFILNATQQRPELALGADLLAPEGYGEIIGGGERATNLEFLEQQIRSSQFAQRIF